MRIIGLLFAAFLPLGAVAQDIAILDAYARSASPNAKSGAVFLTITNSSDTADRLIAVRSNAAKRVALHQHISASDGMIQMLPAEQGFDIPAHGNFTLARGADHIMLMGLTAPFRDVTDISLTLVFEQAGDVLVTVPVDQTR